MKINSQIVRFFIFTFLICALLPSCRAPKDLVFKEAKNFSIQGFGFSTTYLKVDLVYYNPNNFGMELKRTDLDVFIDNTYLGHSSQELQVAIPSLKTFSIPLKVELDMKNLLKNGLSVLFNKDILVKLTGNVKVGKGGIYKNFKVNYQTTQHFSPF